MRAIEPCGCKHDGVTWLALCTEHNALEVAIHARARDDYYRTATPDPERKRALGQAEGLV